jgi:hypothetical protein
MADDCEISSEVSERWLAGRIAVALEQKPKDTFVPNGKCRWCLERVDEGLSFCPSEAGETGCRDDWQADQERKKRAGRIA